MRSLVPLIEDAAGVRAAYEIGMAAARVGYLGANLIHPSHVAIANEAFGPSQEEIEHWTGLVAAVEKGQAGGTSAVVYKGKMVDIAHYKYAREMLKRAADYLSLNEK